MSEITKLDRRDFIKLSAFAGGGLLLGVYLPDHPWELTGPPLQPNVFVRIDPSGTVMIWVGKADMGQGVRTSLPMIIADELDADWSAVEVIQADAHPNKYGRQITVGSSSVRGGAWLPLRKAGATAREMLKQAAASRWGVDATQCRTEKGRVIHIASNRTLSYGELSEAAAELPVPDSPRLKNPSEFRLINTDIPQVDTEPKISGKATFGLDVRLPNLRFATVVHPPVFGGSVGDFDATQAHSVPGVSDVVEISSGVAVVASNTWAAFQGAKALKINWDNGAFSMNSSDISAHFAQLAQQEGAVAQSDGDVDAALRGAAQRIAATYEAFYLVYATMEPMNCTVDVRADRCEIWAPTQNPQGTQGTAARISGLPSERVTVHVTHLGCGWGRRSRTDFVQDAVETSMKVGAPVQVVWTREEDMQHDFFRPAAYCRFEGGLDAEGRATALKSRIVAPPIIGRSGSGVDRNAVDGVANMPYTLPNFHVDNVRSNVPVPTGHWRSVGVSQNTFFIESFIDELAHAAGRDPYEFRRELLSQHARARRVLEVAADKAGWGTPLPSGRARGIAIVENKGSVVAEVAEVSLREGGVRVHRVICAADCGQVIHPGIVEAQMVGSIVCGLTAALYGEITIEAGRVKQSNFHDYPMLRIAEMPKVEVHIVDSGEPPGGVGEPGVPPIAPALTNALFALTGARIRKLPIRAEALTAEQTGSSAAR